VSDFGTVRKHIRESQRQDKVVSHSITAKIIGTLPCMPNEYMAYGHVSEKVAKKFPYHYDFLLLRHFVDIVLYISIYLYLILSLLRRIIPVVAMLSFHAMKTYYNSSWHDVLRADRHFRVWHCPHGIDI
jgi:hypothetical protein